MIVRQESACMGHPSVASSGQMGRDFPWVTTFMVAVLLPDGCEHSQWLCIFLRSGRPSQGLWSFPKVVRLPEDCAPS